MLARRALHDPEGLQPSAVNDLGDKHCSKAEHVPLHGVAGHEQAIAGEVPHRRHCRAERLKGYEARFVAEEWRGGALPLRLFAASPWINATASHVSKDLSKNRTAPSRRLRFAYSVFA